MMSRSRGRSIIRCPPKHEHLGRDARAVVRQGVAGPGGRGVGRKVWREGWGKCGGAACTCISLLLGEVGVGRGGSPGIIHNVRGGEGGGVEGEGGWGEGGRVGGEGLSKHKNLRRDTRAVVSQCMAGYVGERCGEERVEARVWSPRPRPTSHPLFFCTLDTACPFTLFPHQAHLAVTLAPVRE